jgi:hypothetical protein
LQVKRCLELKPVGWDATSLVLRHPAPPTPLLARALTAAKPTLVETLCLRGDVPTPTLRLLLQVQAWETAAAAAVGEWESDPQGLVREEVMPDWRSAVLRAKTKEYDLASQAQGIQYWLGVILAKDAGLAFDWLQARLRDPDLPGYFMEDSPFALALGALHHEQRMELLEGLEAAPILRWLLPRLIGRDLALYEKLLSTERLAGHHLEPLKGRPDEDWARLARSALKAGYDPGRLARISFDATEVFAGPGVEHWAHWDEAFAALEKHESDDLHEVGRCGREMARGFLEEAKQRQRDFEMHGLGGR